jgi:hypothetical protein
VEQSAAEQSDAEQSAAEQTSASQRRGPSVATALRRIELHAAEQQSQLRGIELQSFRSLLVPRHLVIPAL